MSISKGTYAAIPGSPSSGDLYFLTDSFYNLLYYNGSSWDHLLHGKLLTLPPSFAWINQGTASISSANGGETLIDTSAGSSHQCRVRKKSAPSTPYTITAAFLPTLKGINYSFVGVLFRESSSGKLRTVHIDAGAGIWVVVKWDSATSPVAVISSSFRTDVLVSSPLVFWRLEDDGTNRKYHVSGDGVNFVQAYSEGRTVDMTADEIGWFVNAYSQDIKATLIHWKEA